MDTLLLRDDQALDAVPLEHLEHEICQLSAHLAAAMCRWLLLVAEFDRREGWAGDGVRSCAHWLNWRCGVSMTTAHEHVRVARRLTELPSVRKAFGDGVLSYSKARALTRIATPGTETELVVLARHATAAHLDRLARARRSVASQDEQGDQLYESRHLHWFWDDDGYLVLTARLAPDDGAVLLQALDAAAHAIRRAATEARSSETTNRDAGPSVAHTVAAATSPRSDDPAVGGVVPLVPWAGKDTAYRAEDSSARRAVCGHIDSSAEECAAMADDAAASPHPVNADHAVARGAVRGGIESSAEECAAIADDAAASSGPDATARRALRGDIDSSAEECAAMGDDATASPGPDAPHDAAASPHAARAANSAAERRSANRADALVAMAETMLAHGPAARDGGDRYSAVVMVDAGVLAGGDGPCHIEDGPSLASHTAQRLVCDAGVVAMSLGDGGEPLNVGRRTQAIPPAIRRALRVRDGGCRFPGCTQRRFVDGHHIVHWAHGGETSLANLALLCRFHHRAVHEGGYGLVRTAAGELEFTMPAGNILPPAPEPSRLGKLDVEAVNRHLGVVLTSATGSCLWGGERLDLGLAVDAILCLERLG